VKLIRSPPASTLESTSEALKAGYFTPLYNRISNSPSGSTLLRFLHHFVAFDVAGARCDPLLGVVAFSRNPRE
jgi:hypothetical protein